MGQLFSRLEVSTVWPQKSAKRAEKLWSLVYYLQSCFLKFRNTFFSSTKVQVIRWRSAYYARLPLTRQQIPERPCVPLWALSPLGFVLVTLIEYLPNLKNKSWRFPGLWAVFFLRVDIFRVFALGVFSGRGVPWLFVCLFVFFFLSWAWLGMFSAYYVLPTPPAQCRGWSG